MEGVHPCLKYDEALVCAATRGLSIFDVSTEFVRSHKVVGLDFVKFHGCLPHVERNEILWDVSRTGVYKSLTRRRSNS